MTAQELIEAIRAAVAVTAQARGTTQAEALRQARILIDVGDVPVGFGPLDTPTVSAGPDPATGQWAIIIGAA